MAHTNPKHPRGLGDLGEFEPFPLGSNGCPTKILSTLMAIFVYIHTNKIMFPLESEVWTSYQQ
jgi:hypothetical protein